MDVEISVFFKEMRCCVSQKEKLRALIDVAQMQRKVKHIETDKNRIIFELEAEKKSREGTEGEKKVCLKMLLH